MSSPLLSSNDTAKLSNLYSPPPNTSKMEFSCPPNTLLIAVGIVNLYSTDETISVVNVNGLVLTELVLTAAIAAAQVEASNGAVTISRSL